MTIAIAILTTSVPGIAAHDLENSTLLDNDSTSTQGEPVEASTRLGDVSVDPDHFVLTSSAALGAPQAPEQLPIMVVPGIDPPNWHDWFLSETCAGGPNRAQEAFDEPFPTLHRGAHVMTWGYYNGDTRTADATSGPLMTSAVPYYNDHVSNYKNHLEYYPDGHELCPEAHAVPDHTQSSSIRHLAWHWAWAVHEKYAIRPIDPLDPKMECVVAVGYSMGGLMIRYALQEWEAEQKAGGALNFPPDLCIKRVVTWGSPHEGFWDSGDWTGSRQVIEMDPDSMFTAHLARDHDPQGRGGTTWTMMGSSADGTVGYSGTNGGNSDHAVYYRGPAITHFGSPSWYDGLGSRSPESARIKIDGAWHELLDVPLPWAYAYNSLAYDEWGCGRSARMTIEGYPISRVATGMWPAKLGKSITGIPHETGGSCWFEVKAPDWDGRKLRVELNGGGKERDLYLGYGEPFDTHLEVVCSKTAAASEKACLIDAARGVSRIQIVDEGNSRDPFALRVTMSPTEPLELKAVPGSSRATLSWKSAANDGGSPVSAYKIFRDGVWVRSFSPESDGTYSYVDMGLTNGRKYSYELVAVNDAGEGRRAHVSALPAEPPAGPVVSIAREKGQLRLTWTTPSNGGSPVTHYTIYRGSCSGCAPTATVSMSELDPRVVGNAFTDSTTDYPNRYFYTVYAWNEVGRGPASARVSAIPDATPDAPIATARGMDSDVVLSWTAPRDYGQPISEYWVYRSTTPGVTEANFLAKDTDLVMVDKAVTAATTYYYRVAAWNAAGKGPLSDEVSATPYAAPGKPVLTATAGVTFVDLSWTAPPNNGRPIDRYEITKSPCSGCPTPFATVTDGRTLRDTDVVAGRTYTYTVKAHNDAGNGLPSDARSATPQGAPRSPTLTGATGSPEGGVNLAWTLPESTSENTGGAPLDYVTVHRRTAHGAYEVVADRVSLTYLGTYDATTVNGERYYYRITSTNRLGLTSPYSNELEAVTPSLGDDVASATPFEGGMVHVRQSISTATREPGEIAPCEMGTHTVWVKYKATTTGVYQFRAYFAEWSGLDSVLAVWTNPNFDTTGMTCVENMVLERTLTAGQTYWVQVAEASDSSPGVIDLRIWLTG